MSTISLASCMATQGSSLSLGVQCALLSADYLNPCRKSAHVIEPAENNVIRVRQSAALVEKNLCHTVVKIISYITIILPLIAAITFLIAKCYYKIQIEEQAWGSGVGSVSVFATAPTRRPTTLYEGIKRAIRLSKKFNGYKVVLIESHDCYGMVVTGASRRPANLFFDKLFQERSDLKPTLPGTSGLFRFNLENAHATIREYIQTKANTDEIITVNAGRESGSVRITTSRGAYRETPNVNLSQLYGDKTFEISFKELWDSINSQRIYLSPLLPEHFFRELKIAMTSDKWVTLPRNNGNPILLRDLKSGNIGQLLSDISSNPSSFGFKSPDDFKWLMNLTLYQIGSLVVKIENLHLISDTDEKIIQRRANPERDDTLRIITACGIRDIHSQVTPSEPNNGIITSMIQTSLVAAESGVLVLPAVGMGGWGGPPELYWNAILTGIETHGTKLEKILICPGHQKTRDGLYARRNGDEFQEILDEHKRGLSLNSQERINLEKIINLYEQQTDMLDVARNVKADFPQMNVTVFNASNPDVTLGNHVTQHSNTQPHNSGAVEENIACKSTLGLGFAGITGVLSEPGRVIALQ